MEYKQFSPEQLDRAKNADLIAFLSAYMGLEFKRAGKYYQCKQHSSLVVYADRKGFDPTQFSNAPVMVRDFIKLNDIWGNKRVLCVTTMGAFSGDGAGCTARILKKKGAIILGGLQIHMPDSVCDSKMLKKSIEENRKIIFEADKKIEKAALDIQNGKYPQEGISFFSHIIGLFGQRLWFYNKTSHYSDKLKINDSCIGCGLCSQICPMNNITIENNKAVAGNMCTMCYRCISHCPQKAITLIGKAVQEQCQYDKYIK